MCALTLVTAIGGFFSEPVAMAATVIGLVAALGLLFAGHIWFVVIAFQESTVLGGATIFVPLLWIYCLANRIGRSQLAFALLVSALIPALLGLCLAVTFTARYTPEGRAATREVQFAKNADKMVQLIREHESRSPPTGEPRETTYSYAIRIEDPARFISQGDQGLSQFSGYIKGSLRIDETRRRISFQHRGAGDLEQKYVLYLAFETNVLIGTRVAAE